MQILNGSIKIEDYHKKIRIIFSAFGQTSRNWVKNSGKSEIGTRALPALKL